MSDDTFRWVIAGAVGIATLCIFIMAMVSIGIYRVFAKVQTKIEGVTTRVEPILEAVQRLAEINGPKVSEIASRAREVAVNAKDISDVAKDQAHRFGEIGRDIADRAKVQVARVDAAVDDTVDQVHHAGENVKEAVLRPVREAEGVFAGIKAAVTTYGQARRPSIEQITQDEEMFI